MSKILMGHDLSTNARQALLTAAEWSKKLTLPLDVWHIHPGSEELIGLGIDSTFGEGIEERVTQLSKMRRDLLLKDMKTQQITPDKLEIRQGNPWKTIIQATKEKEYQLVVLGLSGATFWHEMLIGSVVQRVAEHGNKSILAFHANTKAIPKNILFACDFEHDSAPALRWCKLLQEKFKSSVHLFYEVNPQRLLEQESPNLNLNTFSQLDNALEQVRGNAELELNRLTDSFPIPAQVSVIAQISKELAPEKSIIAAAKKISADLIIVGTHGRRGAKRWLMGSVAERVLKSAPCNVLLAKDFTF